MLNLKEGRYKSENVLEEISEPENTGEPQNCDGGRIQAIFERKTAIENDEAIYKRGYPRKFLGLSIALPASARARLHLRRALPRQSP